MIHTTTSNLDGREIEKYLGVVVGEAILGANLFLSSATLVFSIETVLKNSDNSFIIL